MKTRLWYLVPLVLVWTGCSRPEKNATPTAPPKESGPASSIVNPKHRYGKLIELAGFRVTEKGPGTLQIKLGVINHSIADLGDIDMKVSLKGQTAKEQEPPFAQFPCKVSLGPEEWQDVTVTVPTKLRIYELPDWQYIRATFEIVSPPS
jgi:hypothetical protein